MNLRTFLMPGSEPVLPQELLHLQYPLGAFGETLKHPQHTQHTQHTQRLHPARSSRRIPSLPVAWSILAGIAFLAASVSNLLAQSTQTTSPGQSVRLVWNASSDASVTGYRIHYGQASGNYTQTLDVGNNTTGAISNLPVGTTWYFVAASYNKSGAESLPSNEAAVIVQPLQIGISSVTRLSNGAIQLSISGQSGMTEQIYASSDMKSWSLLTSAANTTGTLTVSDTNAATLNHRFYRMSDSSGTYAPAGFLSLTISGSTSAQPQMMSYLGLGMTNPVCYSGAVSSVGPQTITDALSNWNPNQFNGISGAFYLEIVSGTLSGLATDIVATDPTTHSLKTADDLSTSLKGGELYQIRRHRTLGDVFGKNDEAKLNGGTSVTTADEVRIFNPTTQSFISFYYQTGGTGGVGWRSSSDPSTDASGSILYPDLGIAICRKVGGNLSLSVLGAAKTGPGVIPVEPNLNLLANIYPAGARTLGNSNLFIGDPLLGLAGGATLTDADEVRIYNGTSFLTYYYEVNGTGGTGWRSSTSSTTDASGTQIPVGASIYVVRKSGRPAFNWLLTQPF